MKKIFGMLGFMVLVVCYQNFQPTKINPWNIRESDEEIRLEHARELLGKYFDRNPVSSSKGIPYFEVHMLNQVQANLPKAFKKRAGRITNAILAESEKHGLDPVFLMAVVMTESRFNPKAVGSVGEIGLMQIKPDTAEWIAKKEKIQWKGPSTLYDPVANIKIGSAYLAFLRDYFDGKASKYLSAYNLGPNKLKRMISADLKPKIYSTNVMRNYKKFYESLTAFQQLHHVASHRMTF